MSGFEENEISKNAKGGTELSKLLLKEYLNPELLDNFQIVASRFREFSPDKLRIYYAHDLADDPESKIITDPRWHAKIFVSRWQLEDFVNKLGIKRDTSTYVIPNPIVPIPAHNKKFVDNKIRLIYFSTPHRGLELLVPVFNEIYKTNKNIHLDVYSSFKLYGFDRADEPFQPLFDQIKSHPGMTYHGAVDNSVIRLALEQAHILAYPCIWKETQCRVLAESMSAGLLCVHPDLAALKETSLNSTALMYRYMDDPHDHVQEFYSALQIAINTVMDENTQNHLINYKNNINMIYGIDTIGAIWNIVLERILNQTKKVL